MQSITSTSNPTFKQALQLHTSRGRKKQNRIIVFGRREISRAIAKGIRPEQIFVPQEADLSGFDEGLIYQVTDSMFEKLSYGSRIGDAIMTAARPETGLENLNLAKADFVTVLEATEKPGNLGGILRSADCSGTAAVIVSEPLTDVYHPNVIRNSMGAAFSVPVAIGGNQDVRARLKTDGFKIWVASPHAPENFFGENLTGKTAVVLGNEAAGVSAFWHEAADGEFKIPMRGICDSLNLSVTAAIVMYEALRQRNCGEINRQ